MSTNANNSEIDDVDRLLGNLLRRQRETAGVTQAEMAEALEVDQSLISRQEAGLFRLNYRQVYEYLEVINFSFQKFAALYDKEYEKLDEV